MFDARSRVLGAGNPDTTYSAYDQRPAATVAHPRNLVTASDSGYRRERCFLSRRGMHSPMCIESIRVEWSVPHPDPPTANEACREKAVPVSWR